MLLSCEGLVDLSRTPAMSPGPSSATSTRRSSSLLRGLCKPWQGDDSSAAAATADGDDSEPPAAELDASMVPSALMASLLLSACLGGDMALLLTAAVELPAALVFVMTCIQHRNPAGTMLNMQLLANSFKLIQEPTAHRC
jgi:hypothetical protein